jgi:hypothetical protein
MNWKIFVHILAALLNIMLGIPVIVVGFVVAWIYGRLQVGVILYDMMARTLDKWGRV